MQRTRSCTSHRCLPLFGCPELDGSTGADHHYIFVLPEAHVGTQHLGEDNAACAIRFDILGMTKEEPAQVAVESVGIERVVPNPLRDLLKGLLIKKKKASILTCGQDEFVVNRRQLIQESLRYNQPRFIIETM